MEETQTVSYDPTALSSAGGVDIAEVGRKVKSIYPNGVATDGRPYSQIPDEEIGSKFILKNGDKGLVSLGMNKTSDTKVAADLRKEFSQATKDSGYMEIRNAWNKVQSAKPDSSGDITILYSYIKALDPESAVREGEINLARAAESVPSNIIRAWEKAKAGNVMSPELRAKITGEIGGLYNEKAKEQKERNAFYTGLAVDSGADPQKVIGGIGEVELATLPEITTPATQEEDKSSGLYDLAEGATKKAADFLLGGTKDYAEQTYKNVKNKDTKALQGQAVDAVTTLGMPVLGLPGIVAKSLNKNKPETSIAEPAVEVGSLVTGAGALSKLPKIISGGGKVARKGVGGFLGEARDKAIKEADDAGVTANLTKAIGEGEKFIQNNPLARSTWNQIKPTLTDPKASVQTVVKKLEDIGPSAFSKGGDAKQTAQGALLKKVYGTLRNELPEDVSKWQSRLSKMHDVEKGAKKLLNPITIGAGIAGAAATGVGSLLGFGRGK